ncbi:MAG TPA: major capsid protein [Novosphingobium sp.]|nr:major capsid protein [Novosphingobium sp.]HZV10549.1 major capsid protein [Novosphingobium sp.]
MVSLDIFHQDPFSTFQMTAAFERIPYLPSQLGDLGIFEPYPIRTTALGIENRDGVLNLIQSSQRGAPPSQDRTTEKRMMRYFEVPRLEQGDTIYSHEVQNIRAFGTETEMMQVEAEVARRVAGPTGLIPRLQYTWENMRLGAIQGVLLDADGSQLYNWFDEFGVAQPAEVAFNLTANVEFTLRGICNKVVRGMWRAAKGAFTTETKIFALCGDAFWDALTQHVDVVKTYYNWQAAQELRQGYAFAAMEFGGIHWFNYRGSDDNSTIKVPDTKVKFFPVDAPGIFRQALAPGESFEWVNTPGKDWYLIPIFDRDRKFWWRVEAYSYPLFICTRPEVLWSGAA